MKQLYLSRQRCKISLKGKLQTKNENTEADVCFSIITAVKGIYENSGKPITLKEKVTGKILQRNCI